MLENILYISNSVFITLINTFKQHEGHDQDRCECFWFPTTLARVSHGDASLLCQGHDA